jgi:hypothetical protein
MFLDKNMDIESLANKVNDFFLSLTDHFTPLSQPTPPMEIPEDFLVTESEVFKALASLQISNSRGPVYEFVWISFRTDNLNCFRAS